MWTWGKHCLQYWSLQWSAEGSPENWTIRQHLSFLFLTIATDWTTLEIVSKLSGVLSRKFPDKSPQRKYISEGWGHALYIYVYFGWPVFPPAMNVSKSGSTEWRLCLQTSAAECYFSGKITSNYFTWHLITLYRHIPRKTDPRIFTGMESSVFTTLEGPLNVLRWSLYSLVMVMNWTSENNKIEKEWIFAT